jgi:PBSX family phage terminase large subunit
MNWTEKQQEFLDKAVHRWNIKCGATRSGKTYLDYFMIPKRIHAVRGLDGLIILLGNTRGTLQRNVIEPMQKIWGEFWVSDIKTDNTASLFGERVYCLGADNTKHVDRLRGTGAKYIYGDEIVSWNEEVFGMVKSRLDKPYSKFDGTCNPGSPTHWLKEFIDGGADIFYQQYSIYDNNFLAPDVLAEMEKEHTGVFHSRYILGEWALADGLVYPNFDRERHVILPPSTDGAPLLQGGKDKYWISVDYGTQNATAMLLWRLSGGVYYCVDEFYHSGRDSNRQKTVGQYYDALVKLAGCVKIECVIVDPSASCFITEIRSHGRFVVRNAKNDVLPGISDCSTALQRGIVKFNSSCKNTIQEFGLYSWDAKALDDRPMKENDHCMDAFRYAVHTLGWVREPIALIGQSL